MDDCTFESLFRIYNAGLKVYAFRLIRQREIAEDIVHDVFMRLWAGRDRINPETVKAYLFSSVRNECLKYIEHLKVKSAYQQKVLQKGDVPGSITWEYYILSELESRLQAAMEKLPLQQRRILTLSRMENKTSAVIAEELGLSPRTVEKHIEMALAKIRKELAEYMSAYLFFMLFIP